MKYSKRLLGAGSTLLLLTGLVSGCAGSSTSVGADGGPSGSSGAGPGPSAGPISLQQLPDQLAAAFCDNIAGCCHTAAIAFDLATCQQALLANLNQSVAMETSPNIKYDANAAGSCVAAYASEVKSCKLDETVLNEACRTVFVGSLPPGAPCTVSDECSKSADGDAYCDTSSPSSAQGTCVSLGSPGPHGKQGETCGGTCTSNSCSSSPSPAGSVPLPTCFNSDGLYCGPDQTCQPLVALGQPCESDACKPGTFCKFSTTPSGSFQGACAAVQSAGAPCMQDEDCAGGLCMFGAGNTPTGICGSDTLANDKTCSGAFQ